MYPQYFEFDLKNEARVYEKFYNIKLTEDNLDEILKIQYENNETCKLKYF